MPELQADMTELFYLSDKIQVHLTHSGREQTFQPGSSTDSKINPQ